MENQTNSHKIVVLNECFLSETDLCALRKIGPVTVYENTTTEALVIERLQGATIAIADIFLAPFTARVFKALPFLQALCVNSSGYDRVDKVAAAQNGVKIYNLTNVFTEATAEFTMTLMLGLLRHVVRADSDFRAEPFEIDPGNKKHQAFYMGESLRGKTLGIIGLGAIGTRVAVMAQAFGMHTVAYTRTPKTVAGVSLVDWETLLATSDIITLHVNLNEATRAILNAAAIQKMKNGARVVCTASIATLDTEALVQALQTGKVAGAALDVYAPEHAAFALPNVLLAPHAGGFSRYAYNQMGPAIVQNVQEFIMKEGRKALAS